MDGGCSDPVINWLDSVWTLLQNSFQLTIVQMAKTKGLPLPFPGLTKRTAFPLVGSWKGTTKTACTVNTK